VEDTIESTAAEIVIGRRAESASDVDLSPDPRVSRTHARLFRDGDQWMVEDLGSRNGTLLNGQPLTAPAAITSGSVLHVGQHVIHIDLSLAGADLPTEDGPGSIAADVLSRETVPPAGMTEDDVLGVLARLQEVVGYARSQADMLDGALRQVRDAFRAAERASIVLVDGGELVVRAFWPRPVAGTSFTLARRAIESEHALLWRRAPGVAVSAPSLSVTATALYAPMMRGGRAVGAVHLDTESTTASLADRDLPRLTVMANIIGAAVDVTTPASLPRLPGVFVSYAHSDREFTRRLVGDLRRRQIRVWLDERLQSGEAWRQQLRMAIAAADALLLVLSPASASSDYVRWEVDIANELGKLLVPAVFQRCDLPDTVRQLQYVNLEKDYTSAVQQLKERLMPLAERAI
jgi:hypothetical protein